MWCLLTCARLGPSGGPPTFLVRKFLPLIGECIGRSINHQNLLQRPSRHPRKRAESGKPKKGEKILAIAIDDTVILKKIVDKSFQETLKPVWDKAKQMGLTEEDVNALVEEARA